MDDLKYNFARCISYNNNLKFIYRDINVDIVNEVRYLHFLSKENYTRDVKSEYRVSIKNNTFTHEQLCVIFKNLEYICDLIHNRVINIFDDDYDMETLETLKPEFNNETKELIFRFAYQIQDRFAVDCKNTFIVETIINILLDAAEELKDTSDEDSVVTISNNTVKTSNTNIQL